MFVSADEFEWALLYLVHLVAEADIAYVYVEKENTSSQGFDRLQIDVQEQNVWFTTLDNNVKFPSALFPSIFVYLLTSG